MKKRLLAMTVAVSVLLPQLAMGAEFAVPEFEASEVVETFSKTAPENDPSGFMPFMTENEEISGKEQLPPQIETENSNDKFIVKWKKQKDKINDITVTKKQKKEPKRIKVKTKVKKHKKFDVIEVSEKVDGTEFIVGLLNEYGNEIESVQPDYILPLTNVTIDALEAGGSGSVPNGDGVPEEIPASSSETEITDSYETDNSAEAADGVGDNVITEDDLNVIDSPADAITDSPNSVENPGNESTEDTPNVTEDGTEDEQPTPDSLDSFNCLDYKADLKTAHETASGRSVKIAVIDGGVDFSHEALAGRLIENTMSGSDIPVDLGLAHGTHVAGIIAKTAPDAEIIPLRVFKNGSASTSFIIDAIEYAESLGAQIVNCSFGSTDDNPALKEAISESSMLFVTAAGNNRVNLSETPVYPAAWDLPNIISVGSINSDGGMSYFSNYGNVDIAAWGRGVISAMPDNKYGEMSGTSMSCAFVSGGAALAAELSGDVLEAAECVKNNAVKINTLDGKINNSALISFSSLVGRTEHAEKIEVFADDDFDTFGYEPAPAESWELFSANRNVKISAGFNHAAAVKENGELWMWGNNYYGQLGLGDNIHRSYPVKVPGLTDVVDVECGAGTTFAVKSNGTVVAMGNNSYGTLGINSTTNKLIPTAVPGLIGVKSISTYLKITLALKTDGSVWVWGESDYGLGTGSHTLSYYPVKITSLSDVKAVSSGHNFAAAVKNDGKVWVWGDNFWGQLGMGSSVLDSATPIQSPLTSIKDVQCSEYTLMALDFGGQVFINGYGSGINSENKSFTPVKVTLLKNITAISTGYLHHGASDSEGRAWIWGNSSNGQSGNGALVGQLKPAIIEDVTDISQISLGRNFTLVMKSNGTIYSCGSNESGELADGSKVEAVSYEKVNLANVKSVAVGNGFTAALTNDGSVYAWGANSYGQLGDGSTYNTPVPKKIASLPAITSIAAGLSHVLALDSSGMVWSWGNNSYGQLGGGSFVNSSVPIQIAGLDGVSSIACGSNFSAAVKTTGELFMWGSNSFGQLGISSAVNKPVPTKVTSLSSVRSISCGDNHIAAVTTANVLYTWGKNTNGQLGDGTTVNRLVPKKITLSGASSVLAGASHTIVLAGSKYYGFGDNSYGQVTGTPGSNILTPAACAYVKMFTGYNSTADFSGLTIFPFGSNAGGQLGLGTKEAKKPYGGETGFNYVPLQIAYGNSHSMVVLANGELYAAGINSGGQLGLPTSSNRAVLSVIGGKFADGHGDSRTDAAAITVPDFLEGALDFAGDHDYFSFKPSKTGVYQIGTKSAINTSGYLYNSSGGQLASNNNGSSSAIGNSNDFFLSYSLTAGQQYFVRVSGSSTSVTGPYRLKIATADIGTSEKTIMITSGKDYYLPVSAYFFQDPDSKVFTVTYPAATFDIVNLAVITGQTRITAGTTGSVTIKSVSDGRVEFTVENNMPDNHTFTGILNIIHLRAKVTGSSLVKVEVK